MQRHCKRYKKTLTALIAVVITITLAVLPSFALTPINPYNGGAVASISLEQAQQAVDVIEYQRLTGSTTGLQMVAIYQPGLYGGIFAVTAWPTLGYYYSFSNNNYYLNNFSESYLLWELTSNGFRIKYRVEGTTIAEIPESNMIAYKTQDGEFAVNVNFPRYEASPNSSAELAYTKWSQYYNDYINALTQAQQVQHDEAVYAQGELAGRVTGYNSGYQVGYDDGRTYERAIADEELREAQDQYDTLMREYEYAYENGYAEGREDTYPIAYQEGYDKGYVDGGNGEGEVSVITENLDIGSIISALPEGAKAIINGAFGFEIFGINVAGTLTAILVVAIVGFVVKWLLSLKS